MFPPDEYELLDFGDGRKLERFGEFHLDRPCPAAQRATPANEDLWDDIDAEFVLENKKIKKGQWYCDETIPLQWLIRHGCVTFELKLTPHGHIGLFAEQAANWDWLAEQVEKRAPADSETSLKVLNLFAYTGGSTLTAAGAGAAVTHIDSAKNIVGWARRNAELSELADRPVRWIAEDAMKFVNRELQRGNFYDAVILDPPSYGHGPKGEVWKIDQKLPQLVELCAKLTRKQPAFVLLTCHSPTWDAKKLRKLFVDHFPQRENHRLNCGGLFIESTCGIKLPSGNYVRYGLE